MKPKNERFLYVPRNQAVSNKTFNRIMLSSLLGILLCGICLASLTWAWFSDSETGTANAVKAARFEAEITVLEEGTERPLIPSAATVREEISGASAEKEVSYLKYQLTAGKTYRVTVTATDRSDADLYGGYCKIKCGAGDTLQAYFTVQFYPQSSGKTNSVSFTVLASDTQNTLLLLPQWGTYAGTATAEHPLIGNAADPTNHIINSIGNSTGGASVSAVQAGAVQTAETVYTVKQNDTLSSIAASYGTTAEKLAAYNGISDAKTLQIGQQINIPPAGYALPAENVVSSTASDAGQTESTGSSGAQTSLSENGADTSSDSADS